MKILHLCGLRGGGAWIACQRLHDALTQNGIESEIAPYGFPLSETKEEHFNFRLWLWRLCSKDTNISSRKLGLFGLKHIVDYLNKSDADIIHFHIPEYLLSVHQIFQVKKTIIWTLHDSWFYTGCFQYPNVIENDNRFAEGYSLKNKPVTTKGLDVDKWCWMLKKHYLSKMNLSFIAPSRWVAESLKQSPIYREQRLVVIPNCIDTSLFCMCNKKDCRRKFSLPKDGKILLLAAWDLKNKIKGGAFVEELIKKIKRRLNTNFYILFLGKGTNMKKEIYGIQCFFSGFLSDPNEIRDVYSAADVFILPSIIDNLPNVCVEAIACGTPVAAFDVGGVSDIVLPGISGYLAEPYSTDSLTDAVLACLSDDMNKSARQFAEKIFSYKAVIPKIGKFYDECFPDQLFFKY